MNKKLYTILWILLALAGITCICLTAMQIAMAFLCKEYGKAVLFLVVDILCVELAGTAIARLVKMWKKKKS